MADAADVDARPRDLPVPTDDGAADHLRGAVISSLALPATSPDQNAATVLAWPRRRPS